MSPDKSILVRFQIQSMQVKTYLNSTDEVFASNPNAQNLGFWRIDETPVIERTPTMTSNIIEVNAI